MTTPVSFELAKLLKEKGFDEPCFSYWSGLNLHSSKINDWNNSTIGDSSMHKRNAGYYSAPTIAQVVMWLYEKCGIWLRVAREEDNYFYWYTDLGHGGGDKGMLKSNTPTEAYEAAIEYTLKTLV